VSAAGNIKTGSITAGYPVRAAHPPPPPPNSSAPSAPHNYSAHSRAYYGR